MVELLILAGYLAILAVAGALVEILVTLWARYDRPAARRRRPDSVHKKSTTTTTQARRAA